MYQLLGFYLLMLSRDFIEITGVKLLYSVPYIVGVVESKDDLSVILSNVFTDIFSY